MEDLLPFERIKSGILNKREASTDEKYGKKPEERTIEELIQYGVVNINKPQGPTSHQVSDYIKKILHIKKAGHSGTLDPNVTGVLPIALDKATRIVQTLLKSGKEYVGVIHLHDKVKSSKIHKAIKKFTGKIEQLPPVKSSIKRRLRTREIYYLKILEIDDKDILFKIGSEAGFYVRKFCHDFGLALDTKAHMQQLIRTKVGFFSDSNWHSLHDLKDAYESYKEGDEAKLRKIILPFEFGIFHLPKVWVLDSAVDSLCHGAYLASPGVSKLNSNINKDSIVAIFTLKNELICLGKALFDSDKILGRDKGIVIKNSKVFMEPGIYPKYIK